MKRTTRSAPRQERDQLGRRLCRMPSCKLPVPKGRISYCSKKCAMEFEIRYFPTRTRSHVDQRDRGVCALCGVDTEKVRRVLRWLRHFSDRQTTTAVALELGYNGYIQGGDFWQADHVVECVRGGWGAGLEQLRTLCTPCHKSETARLARELAEERREAKVPTLFGESEAA